MVPERGYPVVATVKSIKGTCNACHRIGDMIPVSARNPGGLCGYLYFTSFPSILLLQFGGNYPWDDPDCVELDCPDKNNQVTIELRRIR